MTDEERHLLAVAESLAQALVPTVKRLISGLTDDEALASARRIVAQRLASETGLRFDERPPHGDHGTGPRQAG